MPSMDFGSPGPAGNATGAPGPNVTVYEFSNQEYFQAQLDGTVAVRPEHANAVAIRCDTGWGRSCELGVGVPTGSACYCKSLWGPIWGHAV